MRGLGPLGSLGRFVGPEGGLTGAEIANAGVAGIAPVTLGRRILRAETAAVATALAALNEMD